MWHRSFLRAHRSAAQRRKRFSRTLRSTLMFEQLERRELLAITAFTNPLQPLNVSGDAQQAISPLDVLLVVNEINAPSHSDRQTSKLPVFAEMPTEKVPYLDVSCDGYVTAIDALLVINSINTKTSSPSLIFQPDAPGDDSRDHIASVDCHTELREGSSFSTLLNAPLTIPAGARSLRLTYSDLAFDTTSKDSIRDAFEVALVDQQGAPLVHSFTAARDAFFNVTEGQSPQWGVNANQSDGTIDLDLEHIPAGTHANLLIRLVNPDADSKTSVLIKSLEVLTRSLGTPAGATLAGEADHAPTGPVDFGGFEDVTSSMTPRYGQTSLVAGEHLLHTELAMANTGNYVVGSKLLVAIDHLSDPTVRVRQPDGITPSGLPYFVFEGQTAGQALLPGQQTEPRELAFSNPSGTPFTYDLVVLGSINRAPEITSDPNREALVGKAYRYPIEASDPDADTLNYALVAGPQGMTMVGNSLVWTPTAADKGNQSILVRISDGHGGVANQQYNLTVIDPPPNRPPVVTSTPVVDARIGTPYVYDVRATDADGDPLTFRILDGQPGTQIDSASGRVTWNPTPLTTVNWDAAKDFSAEANPAGPWSYGTMAGEGARLHKYPRHSNINGLDVWDDPNIDSASVPTVIHNGGQTAFTESPNGTALQLDGVDDFVQVPDTPALRPTNVTLEGWANFASHPPIEVLFGKTVGDSFLDSYQIWYQDGQLKGAISDGNQLLIVSAPWSPILNHWYHVAFTFDDATDTEALYIDGARVATGTTTASIAYDSHPFEIGKDTENGSPAFFFQGALDEVRLWNVAHTDAEIRNDMFRSLTGSESGLAAYYQFQSSATNVVADSSMNQLQGSLSPGGPTYIDSAVPFPFQQAGAGDGLTWQPGQLSVHPGNENQRSVIRWTAPAAGDARVSAAFASMDGLQGASTDVHVLHNGHEIFSGNILGKDSSAAMPATTVSVTVGDTIDFLVGFGSGSASFDTTSVNAQISMQVATDSVPITLAVDDGRGGTAEQSFRISLRSTTGNHDPVIVSEPRDSLATGQSYSSNVIATDPDADPLTYSLQVAPDGMTIDAASGLITWNGPVASPERQGPAPSNGLTLAPEAQAAGYKLIEFATGFPVSEGLGPLGIAFPRDGGVLISDHSGNVRKFPDDTDAQNASAFVPAQDYGSGRAFDMTQAGDKIYMSQRDNGAVVQINDDGTLNQLIVDGLASPHGIVVNPSNGHLLVSSYTSNVVYDVDPIEKTKRVLFNASLDGISISPDGSTLYGAAAPSGADHVYGFSLLAGSVGNVVFDSGFVPGDPDGAAVGSGTLAGTIIVNTNQGTIIAINLKTKQQTVLATGGTRGDFVKVDPSDGTLLLTQTATVARLQLPAGSSFLSDYKVDVRVEDGRGGSDEKSFILHMTDAVPGEIHGHISETPPAPAAVPGTANIWLAGMPDGTTDAGGDVVPAQSPTEVTGLNLTPGNSILFDAQGSVAFAPGSPLDGPDGSAFAVHGSQFGLSSVTAPADALLAVFLAADQPDQSAAPQGLDFSSNGNVPLGINYLSLAPKLKQVFFVGDGKTASGVAQQVIIPAGATRLFLGTMDGFGWFNNVGSFSAHIGAARTVYLDQNQDNRRDISEDSTLADVDGNYAFVGLAPGTYYVRQELSPGLQQAIPADGASQIVVLTDGEQRQNVDFTNVSRVGERANRPPTITSTPPTEVQVGEQMLYRVNATDADGDALSFDLPVHPSGMAIQPSLGVVGWVPGPEDVGTRDVILRASDRFGGVVLQSFRLLVRPHNTPPVITSTPPGPAVANLTYQYPVQAQDADGDALTYGLVNPIGDMRIDPVSGVLRWHPSSADVGTQKIVVVVTDSAGARGSQTIQLNVVASAPNHAPQLYSTHREQVRLGNAYLYAVNAADSDGDPLTYELVAAPAGMSIDTAGVVTWQPTSEQLGPNSVQLKVSDGRGGEVVDQFTINVLSQAGNQPPRITTSPVTSATANVAYEYRVSASDADGDSIAFSLINPPAGMSINSISGVVAWRPTVDLTGQQEVTVQAVDALGSAATQRFVIQVRGADLPPAIAGTPPTTASVGHDYTYDMQATDPEGQPLSYSLPAGSGNMQVDAQGVIHWQPTAAELGSRTVRVRVTDPQGASTNQSFVVVVNDLNPNQLPVITSTPLLKAALNQPYTYQVQATDAEGGPLHFSFLEWPNEMTIDENTGLIQWTSSLAGIGRVTVLVSDEDGGDAEQSFEIVVGDDNRAPTITSSPTPAIAASQTFRYDVHASDPDGDELAYTLSAAPTGMTIDALGRIVWSTSAAVAGPHHVKLTVSDGRGGSATQDFDLTVTVDTQAPNVSLATASPIGLGDDLVAVARATDNVGVEKLDLTIDGVAVPLDSNGRAVLKMTRVGTVELLVTATDAAGNIGRKSASVTVIDSSVTDAPEVELTSPSDDANITSPTDIVGTVADAHLLSWRLEVLNFDGVVLKQIASGASQVAAGKLGVFDPTLLPNDSYILRLTATNTGGLTSSTETVVNVSGGLKLGNFSLAFVDLVTPVGGIPITINRTYNTFTSSQDGELGFGWKLTYRDVDLRTNLPKTGDEDGGLYTPFRDGTRVYVTLPGGQREGFTFRPKAVALFDPYQSERDVGPEAQSGAGLRQLYFVPYFVPDKGVTSRLDVLKSKMFKQGHEYFQFGGGLPYNPADATYGGSYTLTTKEGLTYRIDATAGTLKSIADLNGNSLEFGEDRIHTSSGLDTVFERDLKGRITSVIDPKGDAVHYSYDNSGDLIAVIDQAGNKTQFAYSTAQPHYLEKVTDPRGNVGLRLKYDDSGRLTEIGDANGQNARISSDPLTRTETRVDALGNTTSSQYDERGNLVASVDAVGHATHQTYDDNNNLVTVTDALGNTSTYTYDENGNQTATIDALGNQVLTTYDSFGRVVSTTSPTGLTSTIEYDEHGNPLTVRDSSGGVTRTSYDDFGNPISVTDATGHTSTYEYDALGRLTKSTDAGGKSASFTYDAGGNRLSESQIVTTPQGAATLTTTYAYDALGRVTSEQQPDGAVRHWERNALGQTTSETDALGRQTVYTYDARGQLLSTTYPDGSVTSSTYDAAGRQSSHTDRSGATTRYVRDALGRIVETIYPDSTPVNDADKPRSRKEYDAAGRVSAQTGVDGIRMEYTYDSVGRIIAATDPLGNVTSQSYDAEGNRITETDALGRTTQFVYDAFGRVVRVIYADGTSVSTSYTTAQQPASDNSGAISERTDEEGRTTRYAYDDSGNLRTVTDAAGGQTVYGYDEAGRLTSEQDANGHITHYEYDANSRRTATVLPMGQRSTNSYDAAGQLIATTDFNQQQISYTYSSSGKLAQKTFPGGNAISFSYTALGDRSSVIDSRGTTRYAYDAAGQLSSVTAPDNQVISYGYDTHGRQTTLTTAAGTTTTTYDGLGRRSTMTAPDGGSTRFTYDAVGNLVSTELPNGNVETRTYDSRNRLASLKVTGGATLLLSYRYTYSRAGQRLSTLDEITSQSTSYRYDMLGRLASETTTDAANATLRSVRYTYDAVGNRLRKDDSVEGITTYVYDANDRLLSSTLNGKVTQFTYDGNGNELTRTTNDGEQVVTSWDAENRLVGLTITSPSGTKRITYAYDADGNRVAETVDGVTTLFLLDTSSSLSQLIMEYDATGAVIVSYVRGDRVLSESRSGVANYPLVDGLGSIVAITNAAGVVVNRVEYDAYGRVLSETGEAGSRFGFAGEQHDAASGLSYMRARTYDPITGRWSSRDPFAGYQEDPITRQKYVYAANDPVNKLDPSGRNVAGGVVGALVVVGIADYLGTKLWNNFVVPSNFRSAPYEFAKTWIPLARDWVATMQDVDRASNVEYFGINSREIQETWSDLASKLSAPDDAYLDAIVWMKTTYQLKPNVLADTTLRDNVYRIRFFPLFFSVCTNTNTIGYVVVHELMHALEGKIDVSAAYGYPAAHRLAQNDPSSALMNAENYALQAQSRNRYDPFE